MSTNNFRNRVVFYRHSISHVVDRLRLYTTKPRANSGLRRFIARLSIGIIACVAMACSSEGNKNIIDAASAIQGASGSGGSIGETAGSIQDVGSGGTNVVNEQSGRSGSANATAGTGGNQSTGGVGGAIAENPAGEEIAGSSGTDGQLADSGVDAQVDESGVTTEAGESEAGSDATPQGCDKIPPSSEDCSQPLAPGDDRKCTMRVGTAERYYYLYAPPTYNPCEPTALIIDCHGAMEAAEVQAGIRTDHTAGSLDFPGVGSGWRLEADTDGGGFIVATPAGINEVWTTLNSDPEFFMQITEETKKIANIADDKVYMTGISNGSIISFQTACPNTDVFSGIAAHSAGSNCTGITKPLPVIAFDAQPDFAYTTTVSAIDTMVRLNGCDATPDLNWLVIDSNTTDTVCRDEPFSTDPKLVPCNTITQNSETQNGIQPTVCKRWDNCDDGVAVVFCDVAPATRHGAANASVDAHILYSNASSLNTPSVAWRFFKSFWK